VEAWGMRPLIASWSMDSKAVYDAFDELGDD
jgi:hypothetical protein